MYLVCPPHFVCLLEENTKEASVPSRDHDQLNCKSLSEKLQLLRNILGAVCKTNCADHCLCKGVTTIYIKVCLTKVEQSSFPDQTGKIL